MFKKNKEKTKEIEVENFKKLILEMHKGFPNWRYFGMVEGIIKDKSVLNELIKEKIFLEWEAKGNTQKIFMLGPTGLTLVNSWKTEELTRKIFILTWVMIILMIVQIILTVR